MIHGSILLEESYAQGKMLDSSSWFGLLPRDITPSDIDHIFDNNGRMIFVEFSKDWKKQCWKEVPAGQRRIYQSLIMQGQGKHIAALCFHSVPRQQQINTRTDIKHFQLMYFDPAYPNIRHSQLLPGVDWEPFVKQWFANPFVIRNEIEYLELFATEVVP